MRDPIEYFMSVEVTLSDKLLEVLYLVIGLLCIYTAFVNLKDKKNDKNIGTFIFWLRLGLMFVLGPWLSRIHICFITILEEDFALDYYTEVDVTIEGAKAYNSYEDVYFDVTDPVKSLSLIHI